MANQTNVLVIDDDKIVQKIVHRSLQNGGMSARMADDGESGIEEALREIPDIILLDVEMPGINGFEVCERLRNITKTADVPIVFLSSHSSLKERLQGYEVGADDYIVKPFEEGHLLARISVLIKYRDERRELKEQFEAAHKTAMIAMIGTNELAQAMRFVEKSLALNSLEDIAQGLFDVTDQLSLKCCLLIISNGENHWFASQDTISPLEKELIEMSDSESRFLDFGIRTLVNFPSVRLLVKNMPLENMERYGRIKDLLPILLSAVNTKIVVLATQEALTRQSIDLIRSFDQIRSNLYRLASTILNNREHSNQLMRELVQDLHEDLLRMGLEEDQEDYLLRRIDSAIEDIMEKTDAGIELYQAFSFVRDNLKAVIAKQEALLNAFTASQAAVSAEETDELSDDIELF